MILIQRLFCLASKTFWVPKTDFGEPKQPESLACPTVFLMAQSKETQTRRATHGACENTGVAQMTGRALHLTTMNSPVCSAQIVTDGVAPDLLTMDSTGFHNEIRRPSPACGCAMVG